MAKKINIKYTYDNPEWKLEKIKIGDWLDLRAAEDVFIPLGEVRKISLGVAMQLPKGYEAHVLPRSSTFDKWGIMLTNSMGIIDNSYCGDNDIWSFQAISMRPAHTVNGRVGSMIKAGDRICQFRIVKNQPKLRFIEYLVFLCKDRGGYGSTGTN